MKFLDQPWLQRMDSMGDEAEAVFDELHPQSAKYGINRPPFRVGLLPAHIRHTPDRLLSDGLVECQGIGRDQTLKLKFEKYGALMWWNSAFPTRIFVWDRHMRRYGFITLDTIAELLDHGHVHTRHFPEGIAYLAIHAERLDWHGTLDG